MKRGALWIICLLLITSACSEAKVSNTPTVEPTVIKTYTPSQTITLTNTPSATPSYTNTISWSDSLESALSELPKGTYLTTIAYGELDPQTLEYPDTVQLNFFDTNEYRLIKTVTVPDRYYFSDPSGSTLFGFSYRNNHPEIGVIDFTDSFYIRLDDPTIKSFSVNIPKGMSCYNPVLSPDGKKLLAGCDFRGYADLFILSADEEPARITNCASVGIYCGRAKWSADGNWITYIYSSERSGYHPYDGLYEAQVVCNESSPPCFQTGPGPFFTLGIAFSSNGKRIAMSGYDEILIYRPGQIALTDKIQMGIYDEAYDISWSPNDQWLALVMDGKVYMLPVNYQADKPIFLGESDSIPGWIVKP